MHQDLMKKLTQQLDDLIAKYGGNQIWKSDSRQRGERTDLAVVSEMAAQTQSAAERIGGRDSVYHRQASTIFEKGQFESQPKMLLGVLKALREDVANGHLQTVGELIHAAVFGDFLDQAEHLLGEGYKTPAAVIAGVSLETHLRKLCDKHSIPTEAADSKGKLKPKKADTMNAELTKAKVYSGGDQKQVTAWLDKRNDAAHGKDKHVTDPEIRLMIDGIRNFITRHPA